MELVKKVFPRELTERYSTILVLALPIPTIISTYDTSTNSSTPGTSWLGHSMTDTHTTGLTSILHLSTLPRSAPTLILPTVSGGGRELQVTKTLLSRNRITAGGEYRDNIRQDQANYYLNPYSLLLEDKRNPSWERFTCKTSLPSRNLWP